MSRSKIALTALLMLVFTADARSQEEVFRWSQFRGPQGSGRAESQTIPNRFGPGINELWSTEIPPGSSSPVVWEEHVFITGHKGKAASVESYSFETGELQWSQSYPLKYEEDYLHIDCSPAAPTSCCDGERVYSYFGPVGLLAHDLAGNLIWRKEFPDAPLDFGITTSPIILGDKLFLVRDVSSLSAVYCIDTQTGREIWMTARPERLASHSTPIIWNHAAGKELVIAGWGCLDSYSLDDGQQIWTIKNLPLVVCPSPAANNETLVFGAWTTAHTSGADRLASVFDENLNLTEEQMTDPQAILDRFDSNHDGGVSRTELPESRLRDAFRFIDVNNDGSWSGDEMTASFTNPAKPGRNVMIAVRPGGSGDISNSHVLWSTTNKLPYVASPLIDEGRIYYVKKGGFLTCLDLASGEAIFQARLGLGGEYYSTPIRVGNFILIAAERGKIFTIRAGEQLEIVGEADFQDQGLLATPAVSENRLIVRTTERLYAFGHE